MADNRRNTELRYILRPGAASAAGDREAVSCLRASGRRILLSFIVPQASDCRSFLPPQFHQLRLAELAKPGGGGLEVRQSGSLVGLRLVYVGRRAVPIVLRSRRHASIFELLCLLVGRGRLGNRRRCCSSGSIGRPARVCRSMAAAERYSSTPVRAGGGLSTTVIAIFRGEKKEVHSRC